MLIKTKKDLKLQAQELASDLGFSLTDIVNASLRQFVINQGIVISKLPTETLDAYTNKKEIIGAYIASESSLSKDWYKEEEKKIWRNFSKDKFLKSYNKSDAIYDQI